MNSNPAMQNVGVRFWTGAAAFHRDIRKYRNYGFTFEVIGAIATDAVFEIQSAPPSAADDCVPQNVWTDVDAIPTCAGEVLAAGVDATFTIPAGTPVNSIGFGTLPCRPDAFIRPAAISGTTANVVITFIGGGPIGPGG